MNVEWQSIDTLPSNIEKAIFWDKWCKEPIAVEFKNDLWFISNLCIFNEDTQIDLNDISHWIVLEEPKDCLRLREEFIVSKDE